MKKILFLIVFTLFTANTVHSAQPFEYRYTKKPIKYVYHPHNESSYQHAYAEKYGGQEEYILPDKTRIDILTGEYCIEFDFVSPGKPYEAVGQALHYQVDYMQATGEPRKPKVVLILDKKFEKRQMHYYERIKRVGDYYGFEVEYITDDILNIDENGRCPYKDCKCHKHKKK